MENSLLVFGVSVLPPVLSHVLEAGEVDSGAPVASPAVAALSAEVVTAALLERGQLHRLLVAVGQAVSARGEKVWTRIYGVIQCFLITCALFP